MKSRLGAACALVAAALAIAASPVGAMCQECAPSGDGGGGGGGNATGRATRDVLYVGNNWDGTAHVVDPRTFRKLARIDIIPDREQRMAEITTDPVALGFFLGIREQVGEGHDQFVDDMFSSPDGRTLYVSRPSFKDVIAMDLATRQIV